MVGTWTSPGDETISPHRPHSFLPYCPFLLSSLFHAPYPYIPLLCLTGLMVPWVGENLLVLSVSIFLSLVTPVPALCPSSSVPKSPSWPVPFGFSGKGVSKAAQPWCLETGMGWTPPTPPELSLQLGLFWLLVQSGPSSFGTPSNSPRVL